MSISRVPLKNSFRKLTKRFFVDTRRQKRSVAGLREHFDNAVAAEKIESRTKWGFLEVPSTDLSAHPPLWSLLPLVLLFTVNILSAQEEALNLSVDKSSWTIGVSVLENENESPTLQSYALILSKLIRDELTRLDTHILSEREQLSLAKELLEDKAREHIEKIDKLYKTRDDMQFDLEQNVTKRSNNRKEIAKENESLTQIRQFSPMDVVVPDSLPTEFPTSDQGTAIWELNGTLPDLFRRTNNLDILVSGSINQVGDYFGVALYAWTELGKTTLWEGALNEREFADISHKIALQAHRLVLGRDWASLSVSVEQPDATIVVNGQPVGVGYWSDTTLEPGLVYVEVSLFEWKSEVRTINLGSGEETKLSIDLEKLSSKEVLVRSIPTGASVRMGTLWIGKTPLMVRPQDRIMPLTIGLDGYRVKTVPFAPESEGLLIKMIPDEGDPMDAVNLARKKFNNAALWFSLSLAPTILLTGVRDNYSNMQQTASTPSDFQEATNAYNVASGAYFGSLAINGGLLTIALVRLARFLNATENIKN